MAIQRTAEHTRTFAELRAWVLVEAKVSNHFDFCKLSQNYANYWEGLNGSEFNRGYVPGEYEKPDTPSLASMKLLTDTEFKKWQSAFKYFHNR